MMLTLTYDEARANAEKVLITGRFTKADVFITRVGGKRFIVKDYSRKGFWERNLVGRVVVHREAKAYASLRGLEGLPPNALRLLPAAFAVEYLDGRHLGELGELDRGAIGPEIVRQLERIIDDLHERGWVHLDLHRRTNILLVNGKVFVVDLASALHPGVIPVLGRVLTRLIGIADRISLIKMKTIFSPQLLTAGELRWLRFRNYFMPTKWDAHHR